MRCIMLVTAAVLTATVAQAQGSFEGVVTYQFASQNGKTMTWDYYSKGGKVLLQSKDTAGMGGMFGGMILDVNAKTRTMIVPSRKIYVTSPIKETVSQHMDSSMRNTKLTKVGSETVAGVSCDDYANTDPSAQEPDTVCIAHGMGNIALFGVGTPIARYEQEVQGFAAAASGGFFPLKMSGPRNTMVATKIERKTLDASLFVPPAGYTQMQMPAGMQQRP